MGNPRALIVLRRGRDTDAVERLRLGHHALGSELLPPTHLRSKAHSPPEGFVAQDVA